MPRIAVATAAGVGDLDEDQPVLEAALAARGIEVDRCVWTDPDVVWQDYPLVVVRSTWDYHEDRDTYLAWIDRVAGLTELENPAFLHHWSTDKRYLRDLEAAAVPVAPTHWIEPGDQLRMPAGEVVVKPAVSAGSLNTGRFADGRGPEAEALVRRLLDEGRAVMVQDYLASIDVRGETGLVFVDGYFLHGFRKGALLEPDTGLVDGLFAREDITPREPTHEERAVAEEALEASPAIAPLYARVDLADGPDGEPVVMELELSEPSLFFAALDRPADPLADAIASRLPPPRP
jgi:glutathione synthase/RimK-type ligase-like ATP-grasp enzyme